MQSEESLLASNSMQWAACSWSEARLRAHSATLHRAFSVSDAIHKIRPMMAKMPDSRQLLAARGFTLVELVVVMVVVGVLSIGVLPRFLAQGDLDARGFFDATESILRYAQKSAIAQRRNVCVAFSAAGAVPTTVTLTIASLPGGACDTALTGPTGVAPHQVVAAVGVVFSAAPAYPANFIFLPSGSASATRTFVVTGLAGRVGTVEAGTGYVHH